MPAMFWGAVDLEPWQCHQDQTKTRRKALEEDISSIRPVDSAIFWDLRGNWEVIIYARSITGWIGTDWGAFRWVGV